MGIVSKLFPRDESKNQARAGATTDWIDLTDYAAQEKTGESGGAATWIRFCQLRALDDLKSFSSQVYDGNILVIDFTAVQGDDIVLRRLTNELRKIAQDTGGDLAGLGEHHILLTPAGVKVDRKRLAKPDADADEPVMRTGPSPASPTPAPSPVAPAGASASPRRTNGGRGK